MAFQLQFLVGDEVVNAAGLTAFSLDKEIYTPYSQLTARGYMDLSASDCLGTCGVVFLDGDTLLHSGTVETFSYSKEDGVLGFVVRSRGYTAMLLQNQLTPGVHYDMSLDKLMTEVQLPAAITWEHSDDTSNYLFVKENAGIWDGVVHLSYKLSKTYPFVRGANEIRMTIPADRAIFSLEDMGELLCCGVTNEQSLLYSDYYMEDADGTDEAFHLHVPEAAERGLFRTKQLPFDEQYLYDPTQALEFRRLYAARRMTRSFAEISGSTTAQLGDAATFPGESAPKTIARILLSMEQSGIKTRLEGYADGFF